MRKESARRRARRRWWWRSLFRGRAVSAVQCNRGIAGGLIGLGMPEYEAKRNEGRLQKGGILLSVHCDTSDEIKTAKAVMERTGGEDIASTSEVRAAKR